MTETNKGTDEPDIPVVNAQPASTAKPEFCTVIAPATLGEGYTFTAQVDGIDFVVTVPKGGVTEGQAFQVPYPGSTSNVQATQGVNVTTVPVQATTSPSTGTDAPTGRWRNGLCECCDVCGIGLFWQGWCCTPILLAQVMARFYLNPIGWPTGDPNMKNVTFYIIAAIWLVALILLIINYYIYSPFYIFFVFIAMNTRYFVRKKYSIKAESCDCFDGRMEDCCCAYWCMCCSTIQMARHTHNQNEHPYECISVTGLKPNAPDLV